MTRRLPPLNGLRAFEAAARHLSFVKAADELNVTPAAISQQVKGLEAFCDVQLFHRRTRALALTDAGRAALPLLRESFDGLEEASWIIVTHGANPTLTISVTTSFGAKWLVPRLERFSSTHPEFDVRIDATEALADFNRDGVDAAIRYGTGAYDGLHATCLLSDAAFPVCSPALLAGVCPLRSPEDLSHHTLLHVDWKMQSDFEPNWRMWLKTAGVRAGSATRGPRFSSEALCIQAAAEGMGVALARSSLVRDDLEAGRLVRPFPPSIIEATQFCYYFVCPPQNLTLDKVKAFRAWLMAESQRSEAV